MLLADYGAGAHCAYISFIADGGWSPADGLQPSLLAIAVAVDNIVLAGQTTGSEDFEDGVLNGNVLQDNGFGSDVDLDGDALTVSLVSGPVQGILTLNSDGSFSYEADADVFDLAAPGDTIDVEFTYQIDDGRGGSDR